MASSRRRRLIEAMFMSDTGDDRSYDDIYGEEGLPEDDEQPVASDAAASSLTADQISQLKDLASQILAILGGGSPSEELDDTALAGDDQSTLPDEDDDTDVSITPGF